MSELRDDQHRGPDAPPGGDHTWLQVVAPDVHLARCRFEPAVTAGASGSGQQSRQIGSAGTTGSAHDSIEGAARGVRPVREGPWPKVHAACCHRSSRVDPALNDGILLRYRRALPARQHRQTERRSGRPLTALVPPGGHMLRVALQPSLPRLRTGSPTPRRSRPVAALISVGEVLCSPWLNRPRSRHLRQIASRGSPFVIPPPVACVSLARSRVVT